MEVSTSFSEMPDTTRWTTRVVGGSGRTKWWPAPYDRVPQHALARPVGNEIRGHEGGGRPQRAGYGREDPYGARGETAQQRPEGGLAAGQPPRGQQRGDGVTQEHAGPGALAVDARQVRG